MPTERVTAKPRIGPVPKVNRKIAAIIVVRLASKTDENAFENMHIQQVMMATSGDRRGVGVLEQISYPLMHSQLRKMKRFN